MALVHQHMPLFPPANHSFMAAIDELYIEGLNLMVLETPLLRVSRPVAACSRCRGAKIKCDGKLPVSALLIYTFFFPSLFSSRHFCLPSLMAHNSHALLANGPVRHLNVPVQMINLLVARSVVMSLRSKLVSKNLSVESEKFSNESHPSSA